MAGFQTALFWVELALLIGGAFYVSRFYRKSRAGFYLVLVLGFTLPVIAFLVTDLVRPAVLGDLLGQIESGSISRQAASRALLLWSLPGFTLSLLGFTLLAVGEMAHRRFLRLQGKAVAFRVLGVVSLVLVFTPFFLPVLWGLLVGALNTAIPTPTWSKETLLLLLSLPGLLERPGAILGLAGILFIQHRRWAMSTQPG